MFEKASRLKLRFKVIGYGNLSTEDLWDLSDSVLDTTFVRLAVEAQKSEVKSLLSDSKRDEVLDLKLDVIRHIFETKKAERQARADKAETRLKIGRLVEIMAAKQDAALTEKSEEDLAAQIEELKAQL